MTTVPSTLTLTDSDREAHARPLSFKLITRLFTYTKPYARIRNWLLVLVLIRAALLPLITLTLAYVLSVPITNGDTRGLVWGIVTFALLAAAVNVVYHFRIRFALQLGEGVVHDLRNRMFAHLQRQTMQFFDRTKIGRVISRFNSDLENVRTGVQDVLFMSLVGIGQMVIAAVIMVLRDPVLFSVIALMAPILWGINRYFSLRISRAHRATQESFSRVTATLAESVNGVRVTQGFARQDVNASMFGDLVASHSTYRMQTSRLNASFIPLLDINSQVFIATLFILGGWRAFGGSADAATIITFLLMAQVFFEPIQLLGEQYMEALMAMAGAERVFGLLDTQPQWKDAPDATDLPRIEGRVQLRDLTFGYDPQRPVLHQINFKAESGQTIALVGSTGSGKSSIINLIAKFYLPTAGELLIDGHDIQKVRGDSLHRQMGIVLQQNFLFSGTVLENIRIGRPSATDAQVVEAAQRLDCLDLLNKLPDGLHTNVGERGGNLSLGQRQLVCFTRAMLADPRILILDEATSSVDTVTEVRIQRALEVLLEDRTSFVVAHRLSTIRHADQVLVLDQGRIVERGKHNQLLSAGGIYANLYRQFIRSSEG